MKMYPRIISKAWSGRIMYVVVGTTWAVCGCAKQEPASLPVTTAPADSEPVTSAPTDSDRTTSKPPATSQPGSEEDAFKFVISLKGPEDRQVDWLQVERWADGADSGYVRGEWIEANKMKIETMNAERIRLRLGRLPISPGGRIIVNLDDKGIEISRSLLPTVRMERSATGRWTVVKDEP